MNLPSSSSPPKRRRSFIVRYSPVFFTIDLLVLLAVVIAKHSGASREVVPTASFSAGQTALPQDLVSQLASVTDVSITITYPKTMLESESSSVELAYDAVQHIREIRDPLSQNLPDQIPTTISDTPTNNHDEKLIVAKGNGVLLSSAGFEVKPEEKLKKDKDVQTPTRFAWTIRPKNAGKHTLHIDLSDLLHHDSKNEKVETYAVVNGEKHAETLEPVKLSVMVYTNVGLSQTAYTVATIIMSILAVIFGTLVFPILVELFKARGPQPAPGPPPAATAPGPQPPAPAPTAPKQPGKKKKKRR